MTYTIHYLGNSSCVSSDLAIVINSYNRINLLKEALPSIYLVLTEIYPKAGIFVFDAGSTDSSIEYINEFSENNPAIPIYLIRSSDSVPPSFSQGCNIAVQVAAENFSNLQWLFFYETDNLMKNKTALQKALTVLNADNRLASVGFTVETDNEEKTEFGCLFPSLLSFVVGQQLSAKLNLNTFKPIRWTNTNNIEWTYAEVVYTSPLLVKYEAWKYTNGMDAQNFPFSDCDVDWCWTIKKQGWKSAVINISGVIHDNRNIRSTWSDTRTLNYHKARFQLLLKHKGRWVKLFIPLLLIRHLTETILLLLFYNTGERVTKSLNQRLRLMKSVFYGYH